MSEEVDLTKHSYVLAIPCYEGQLRTETALSIMYLTNELKNANISHAVAIIKGGALIHNVRNGLVHRFLHQTQMDTLVWVDADVGFTVDAFKRLAYHSHSHPIVAGVYPSRTMPPTFFVNHFGQKELTEDGLLEVDGTGMGFVAVQRQVYEKMDVLSYHAKEYPIPVKAFYQMGYADPDENGVYRTLGEDIWFFKEARRQGFKTFIDPFIDLTHTGPHTFDAKLRDCIDQILT